MLCHVTNGTASGGGIPSRTDSLRLTPKWTHKALLFVLARETLIKFSLSTGNIE